MSSDAIVVRPLDGSGPEEAQALGQVEGWAFGFPPADSQSWFEIAGLENVRVALAAGRVVGGLILIPMGQWFGGRSVPLIGIAGVAVAPEHRGRGVALALMNSALTEISKNGGVLSGLYPATRTLYRAVGYELSGTRYSISVRPGDIGLADRSLSIRPMRDDDAARVDAAYTELARASDGYLDRGPYIWRRVRAPRGGSAHGWVVEGQSELEAYVFVKQTPVKPGNYELALTDVACRSAGGARRVLSFLADHRTLASSVSWYGGPADPLAAVLPEGAIDMKLGLHWMTRIVSVPAALAARGYSASVRETLDLEVTDALLPENAGRWQLSVEAGRGEVRRGGSGAVRLDVRGLAALYTGFTSPIALKRMGWLEGDDAALARARSVFSGPAPCMPDMY